MMPIKLVMLDGMAFPSGCHSLDLNSDQHADMLPIDLIPGRGINVINKNEDDGFYRIVNSKYYYRANSGSYFILEVDKNTGRAG